jgi:fructokinase
MEADAAAELRPPLIGIDFGGTKIEAAALDDAGKPLVRIRAATPSTYDEALATVRDLVARVEAETATVDRIGVGAPGSISPKTGLFRNANTTYLNGRRFGVDLEQTLGKAVRVSNDANCLAVSEAIDGAAAGAHVVFAVIIGTGCGGGMAVDGKLIEGAHGIAGEWGHNPLPWLVGDEVDGPVCWCGRKNCLETWISGTGFRRDFRQRGGADLSGQQIIAAARTGDAIASAALDAYLDRLARALASIANVIDPDVFVFGGGMANVAEIYERVPSLVRHYVFSDTWEAPLRLARWGDSSGIRGAARLWQ